MWSPDPCYTPVQVDTISLSNLVEIDGGVSCETPKVCSKNIHAFNFQLKLINDNIFLWLEVNKTSLSDIRMVILV